MRKNLHSVKQETYSELSTKFPYKILSKVNTHKEDY